VFYIAAIVGLCLPMDAACATPARTEDAPTSGLENRVALAATVLKRGNHNGRHDTVTPGDIEEGDESGLEGEEADEWYDAEDEDEADETE
jgi:hypothetical protein